jgi:Ferritin-like
MTGSFSAKLLPRNAAALRRGLSPDAATHVVAGNPISTRLESAIGNCFPGLEFDIRNLERRFFPFLETDFGSDANGQPAIFVASVDSDGVARASAAHALTPEQVLAYNKLADGMGAGVQWTIARIDGDFGPLGRQTVVVANLQPVSTGDTRAPSDAWTAARLLVEGSEVALTLTLVPPQPGVGDVTLTGKRARYLDDTGAFAAIFRPGELTQSLCSPWTHDFRDCACYYWASNHPDIALPPATIDPPADRPNLFNVDTQWERLDRSIENPPAASVFGTTTDPTSTSGAVIEMPHHRINRDWQQLNFVLERREQLRPYKQGELDAKPLADPTTLTAWLRYGAGVELAVMLEYLSAAWSLRRPTAAMPQPLRDDLTAAFEEIRRVAIGEMRHLRALNDVLAHFEPPPAFRPALGVAPKLPGNLPGTTRDFRFRPATADVLADFIGIEAPSMSVDGIYAPLLATLEATPHTSEQQSTLRVVMAEGEEHWRTFRFVADWLGRHAEADYLRAPNLPPPPPTHPAHVTLQQRYLTLLDNLYNAYAMGLPAGALLLNATRSSMLGPDGIEGALEAVASAGFLPVFDTPTDARFAPVGPPDAPTA